MSLIVKEEKKEYKLIDEGLYIAKCISVIDLGKQTTEYKGEKKLTDQVLLQFEVPEIVIEYEKDGEKKSFNKVLAKTYSMSLGEKSNLRKDLTSWRGKSFTEEELAGFNLKNVLGKDCQIQIIHETKNDKTFQKTNILPVGKGHKSIEVENDLTSFDFEESSIEDIAKFPEWLQEKLKNSPTYEEKRVNGLIEQYEPGITDINPDDYEIEEEIPF